jgi:hypothetical protein
LDIFFSLPTGEKEEAAELRKICAPGGRGRRGWRVEEEREERNERRRGWR